MKFEKSVERQTKNTIEYYKNLDNIEEVPIDILRIMYKDLKEEYRQYREFICVTGGKDIDDITATKYVQIQQEGYLRGRKEEQEKAKQFIKENSISKKKIEDKLKELEENGYWEFLEKRDLDKTINILQELLEDK